jgi:7-carboxy-7-deazaguanine synthase
MKRTIKISEIYGPVIAGEGPVRGLPTVFVRTGGCDSKCDWCDSLHAVLPKHKGDWTDLDADQVLSRVQQLTGSRPLLISLSGGNPALQPLGDLILAGRGLGYTFALETQGTQAREWFPLLHHLIISPKGPSSGMPFKEQRLMECIAAAAGAPEIALKFVVFDEADYGFARTVAGDFPNYPVYLQVGTEQAEYFKTDEERQLAYLRKTILERYKWLSHVVVVDGWFNARVGFQEHVIVHGHKQQI